MWPGLVLLLHLLISQSKVMQIEAAICSAPSKLFHGLCFSDSNCGRICEKEGFISGNCKGMFMKCICFKDCGGSGGGGGGGGPPPEEPPETPSPDDPPPPPTPCPNPPGGCPQPPCSPYPPISCPQPPPSLGKLRKDNFRDFN